MSAITIDYPKSKAWPSLRSARFSHRLRKRASAHRQVVLQVELTEPRGRTWSAIGGGHSLAEAIAFACGSAPEGYAWEPVRWTELYGH